MKPAAHPILSARAIRAESLRRCGLAGETGVKTKTPMPGHRAGRFDAAQAQM